MAVLVVFVAVVVLVVVVSGGSWVVGCGSWVVGCGWSIRLCEYRWTRQADITLSCPMHLADFPYDKQACFARVEPFRENKNQVRMGFGLLATNDTKAFRIMHTCKQGSS